MKDSAETDRLEKILKSHKFSASGFLGNDSRSIMEIIESDEAALLKAGKSREKTAARMREITRQAKAGLETPVIINPGLEAQVVDARGTLPCPWPHPGRYGKTVTTATRTDTGQSIKWSELNIHMIESHGFFEGRGSYFRIEPEELIEIIFKNE